MALNNANKVSCYNHTGMILNPKLTLTLHQVFQSLSFQEWVQYLQQSCMVVIMISTREHTVILHLLAWCVRSQVFSQESPKDIIICRETKSSEMGQPNLCNFVFF